MFSKTYLYKIRLVTNQLDTALDQMLRTEAGITLSQLSLLAAILEHGVINQRQVAHFLGVSPVAVKRQTSLAMQQKLIEIAPLKNAQGRGLHLTPKGRAVIKRGLDAMDAPLVQIFCESDRQTNLMTHIELLLGVMKGVVGERQHSEKLITRKD
jgi:DNA-binding MarR family transcriptional regulator